MTDYLCPHCEREIPPHNYSRHVPICPAQSHIEERVFSVLRAYAVAGCAPAPDRYGHLIINGEMPGYGPLLNHYGSWDALCALVGLRPPGELREARRELSLDEMRRMSRELHDGRYGPSYAEFDAYKCEDALRASTLTTIYDGWENALAAAGLRYADRPYYYAIAQIRATALNEPVATLPRNERAQALPTGLAVKPCLRPLLVWDVATHAYRAVDGVARLSLLLV